MRIKDIQVNDIINKKYWRVLKAENDNWLDWEIIEAHKVNKNDIIVHSGLLLENYKKMAVLHNNKWLITGSSEHTIKKNGEIFLSFISTLNIHEYQKGSFDNRDHHYKKFNFYIKQLNSKIISPFLDEYNNNLPQKYLKYSAKQIIKEIEESIITWKNLQTDNRISKANKLIKRIHDLCNFLKQDTSNYKLMKDMLNHENQAIVRVMQYELVDVYQKECLKLIEKTAKEDSLDGIGAKYWLKDFKGK